MEKINKVFAVLTIYLMIGMVFTSAVFSAETAPENELDFKDWINQKITGGQQPDASDWSSISGYGMWNDIKWEGIKQKEVPEEYIGNIPADKVKVTEVANQFSLNSEQLGYGDPANYEKLD